MNKINFLPSWVETNLQPAFYDLESGTALQQTARMYAKVNQLVRNVNEQNDAIADYIQQFLNLKDYVEDYFDNLDVQSEINNKLDAMVESGEFQSILDSYVTPQLNRLEQKMENGDEALSEQINVATQTLDNKIEAIRDNSPIPVSSLSGMTDTTKIYVNTSDGNWYYYDRTWKIGGQYQSSENSNIVDGLEKWADSYDIKGLISFAIGNIIWNGTNAGQYDSSNHTYVCTPNIVEFDKDIYIKASAFTTVSVHYFNENGTWQRVAFNISNQNRGTFIPANTKIKLVFNYVTPPDPLPDLSNNDPSETQLYNGVTINYYDEYVTTQFNELKSTGVSTDPNDLKNFIRFCVGDINANGIYQTQSDFKRIATIDILKYPFDIKISKIDNLALYIWQYEGYDGSGGSGKGWQDLTNGLVIPANTYFRLLLTPDRNTPTPLVDAYTNVAFQRLNIEKVVYIETPIKYSDTLQSICHQGYTSSPTTNDNKLSGYYLARKQGFKYGECDIKWTSDQVPVCLHDNVFTDDNNEQVTISAIPYSELRTHTINGLPVASFDEVLKACKDSGIGLAIDHFSNFYTTERNNIMFAIIKKYQMQDNVIFLIGNNRIPLSNDIKAFYPKAKFAITVNTNQLETTINEANTIVDNYCEVIVNFNYENIPYGSIESTFTNLDNRCKLGVWTIDNATTYKNYLPLVDYITSNKICYNDVFEDIINK